MLWCGKGSEVLVHCASDCKVKYGSMGYEIGVTEIPYHIMRRGERHSLLRASRRVEVHAELGLLDTH